MTDRAQLKTSDEEIVEEFGRVVVLLQAATRKPLFTKLMAEASLRGLNWVQALEYVIDKNACS